LGHGVKYSTKRNDLVTPVHLVKSYVSNDALLNREAEPIASTRKIVVRNPYFWVSSCEGRIQDTYDMDTHDWSNRRYTLDEMQVKLASLPRNAIARVDMRLNDLPLSMITHLVAFLRCHPGSSICVGNNAFSFHAFYSALQAANAVDLFEMDRLTLGWSEQDMMIGHMAARSLATHNVLQLTEAIKTLQEERRVAFEQEQALRDKERAERDKERAERDKERAERDKERDKERAKREAIEVAAQKARDRLWERMDMLHGYNVNRNNAIEYCVCDAVDDLMRDRLDFTLINRMQNTKLYDKQGSTIGETDGMLTYQHSKHGFEVLVVVEGKAHLNSKEYQSSINTYRKVLQIINDADSADSETSGRHHPRYRFQNAMFAQMKNMKTRLAIGSPIVPDEFLDKGRAAGYLMVHSQDTSYQVINDSAWDRLGDGAATQ